MPRPRNFELLGILRPRPAGQLFASAAIDDLGSWSIIASRATMQSNAIDVRTDPICHSRAQPIPLQSRWAVQLQKRPALPIIDPFTVSDPLRSRGSPVRHCRLNREHESRQSESRLDTGRFKDLPGTRRRRLFLRSWGAQSCPSRTWWPRER